LPVNLLLKNLATTITCEFVAKLVVNLLQKCLATNLATVITCGYAAEEMPGGDAAEEMSVGVMHGIAKLYVLYYTGNIWNDSTR
jgi:hypothetical protein